MTFQEELKFTKPSDNSEQLISIAEADSFQTLYQLIQLNPLPVLLVYMNNNNKVLYGNKAVTEMLGYPLNTILGEEIHQVDLFVNPERCMRALKSLSQDGQAHYFDLTIRMADRQIVHANLSAMKVLLDNEPVALLVFHGIIETKLMKKALKENPKNYQLLLEAIPDTLFLITSTGTLLDFKSDTPEHLYTTPEQFIGKNIDQVLPNDVACKTLAALDRAFETEQIQCITYPLQMNGHTSIFEARLIANLEQKVALAIVRDITEAELQKQALAEEQKKYQLLVENQTHMIVKVDTEGHFLYTSPSYCHTFDKREDELLGQKFAPLVHEQDLPATLAAMENLYQPPYTCYVEQRALTKDGWKWLAWQDTAVLDDEGRVTAIIGLGRDITEQKQAELALADSERRLREAQNIANLGYWEYDHANDHLMWSDYIYRIFGLQPREFTETYEAFLVHVHPDDRQAVMQAYTDSLENHTNYEIDHRVVTKDGAIKYVHEFCETDFDPEGKPRRSLGVVQDITQIMQTENTLLMTSEKLRAIIEHSPFITSEFSPEGVFLSISDKFLEASLITDRTTIIGSSFSELFPPEAIKAWHERVNKVLETRQPLTVKDTLPSEAGDKHFITTLYPLFDKQGNISSLGSIAQDITELREAATQIQETEKRFNILMETAPVGMVIYQEGRFKMFNKRAVELLGAKKESDLLDKDLSDFILPEDLPTAQERIERIYQGSGTQDLILFLRGVDGKLREIEAIGTLTTLTEKPALQISLIDLAPRRQQEGEKMIRLRELEALEKLTLSLQHTDDTQTMLASALDEILNALNLEDGSIMLFELGRSIPSINLARGWHKKLRKFPFQFDRSLSAQVLKTGKPYLVEDFASQTSNPEIKEIISVGWRGVGVPLLTPDGTIGVVWVTFESPRQLDRSEIDILNSMTRMTGISLHRMSLFEKSVKEMEQLQAQHTIGQAVAHFFDLNLTLKVICEQAEKYLPADAISMLLYQPHTMVLKHAASYGFLTDPDSRFQTQLGQGWAGQAALDREIIHIVDLATAEPACHRYNSFVEEGFLCYSAAPMLAKGKLMGILEIFHRQPFEYDDHFCNQAASLAVQAAVAIDDLQIYNDLQRNNLNLLQAYDSTIEGWSQALDLRDHETEGHTQRVTELTLQLAKSLGCQEEDLVHIRRGALLHDMGKMGIPDDILLKPGPLTDEEWEIMKRHPEYAFKMLSPIAYLRPAIDIPYCHHEKWDGSGYPRGLKGKQIPLAARIFAVVDVWDALTSDRPYREAWPQDRVIEHIKEGSDGHFDPRVVGAFLELVNA